MVCGALSKESNGLLFGSKPVWSEQLFLAFENCLVLQSPNFEHDKVPTDELIYCIA
jgi:hypothetical protein